MSVISLEKRIKALEEWKRCYVEELTFQFTEQTKRIKALENPNKDLANDVWIHGRIKAFEEWKENLDHEFAWLSSKDIDKRIKALEESKEHHFTYHEQQQDIIDNRVKALEERADAEHDRVTNLYGKTKALEEWQKVQEWKALPKVPCGDTKKEEHRIRLLEDKISNNGQRIKELEDWIADHFSGSFPRNPCPSKKPCYEAYIKIPEQVWEDLKMFVGNMKNRPDIPFTYKDAFVNLIRRVEPDWIGLKEC